MMGRRGGFTFFSKQPLLIILACLFGAFLLIYLSFHHKSSEEVEVPSTPEVTDRANPQPSLATGDKESKKNEDDHLKTQIKEAVIEANHNIERRLSALENANTYKPKSTSSPPLVKPSYPKVKNLNENLRKRILVTGGAGFVGSHLVDQLMLQGHEVTVVDNYFTGRKKNIEHWIGHHNFELMHHDVVEPLMIEVDQIYHLASPASPVKYMYNPVKTIKSNTIGTMNVLGLAKRVKARVLFSSTSEIYGDPEEHPQKETYWGHVNTIGPRACYDESKRVAETMMYAYAHRDKIEVRVARIFNTYGPRMHMYDGRVVSNFIVQTLRGHPLTVYSPGNQTRSFMYVSDLVDGLMKLMNSNYSLPVNLGNPEEHTILEFATLVQEITGLKGKVAMKKSQQDDPHKRKPDITRAKTYLGWEPKVSLRDGILKTTAYFRKELGLTDDNQY